MDEVFKDFSINLEFGLPTLENSYINKWLFNGYAVISIANVNAIEAAVHTRVPIETWLTVDPAW